MHVTVMNVAGCFLKVALPQLSKVYAYLLVTHSSCFSTCSSVAPYNVGSSFLESILPTL